MITAIVYNSATGSCERYAKELSRTLHIPAYSVDNCPSKADGQYIFVSWILAGSVVGYQKAAKKYDIAAVVAVGMAPASKKTADGIKAKQSIPVPVFSVQGAFNINKLSAPMKLIMKVKTKDIAKQLERKKASTPLNAQEQALLKMARTGVGEPASWDVSEITAWALKAYDADAILRI